MLTSQCSKEQVLNVNISQPQNVYSYDPLNLVLAYGTGLVVGFLILILGATAYYTNGVVHDNYVSSIIRAAQNPDVSIIFFHNSRRRVHLLEVRNMC